MVEFTKKIINFGFGLTSKYVGLRFFIAGGMAGVTDLFFLYIFHSKFGIHYLVSAVLAFIIAFFVSFLSHKYWTFKSHIDPFHHQMGKYLISTLFGLSLNTFLMYVMVDYFHIDVLLSQIIVGLIVAFISFFINRNIIFKYKPEINFTTE